MLCTVAPRPDRQVSGAGRSGDDLGRFPNLPNAPFLLTTTHTPQLQIVFVILFFIETFKSRELGTVGLQCAAIGKSGI